MILRTYTRERWDDLVCAVNAVQNQTLHPAEIIIVVDHNPALQVNVQQRFPDVVVIDNHGPRGSSGAWNSGVAVASQPFLAFTDDDAEAQPDWLERLSECFEHPNVIGAGGSIEPYWLGGRPAWFPPEFTWVVGCTYPGMPQARAAVRNFIGCNMAFRREVFEKNSFPQGMGHVGGRPSGCDETEFCIRLKEHFPQGVLLFEPRARVRHKIPPARTTWRYFLKRCYLEGGSKARLCRHVGFHKGTATERSYLLRILTKGLLHKFHRALFTREWAGIAQASAVFSGLAAAAVGYISVTCRQVFTSSVEI